MNIRAVVLESDWGGKSLVALFVSVLSGVVLSLQYEPDAPFFSVCSIEVLIPFGSFWRACHFYSSQIFFLFSLLHLAAIIVAGAHSQMKLRDWLLLVGSVPTALLLLFSGYVLRADATGEAAGAIAENIILSIPLFGHLLDSLFFAIEAEGMKRVYANHLIGLSVLWVICCWEHLRRYRVNFARHGLLLAGLLLFSLLVAAPLEPARLGLVHIRSPWFLLGLQEILRFVQPFWAGVVFPAAVVIALACVAVDSWRRRALIFTGVWLSLYLLFSLVALTR